MFIVFFLCCDLILQPYVIQLTDELKLTGCYAGFPRESIFSDEADFTPNGFENKQNCSMWRKEKKTRIIYLDNVVFGLILSNM